MTISGEWLIKHTLQLSLIIHKDTPWNNRQRQRERARERARKRDLHTFVSIKNILLLIPTHISLLTTSRSGCSTTSELIANQRIANVGKGNCVVWFWCLHLDLQVWFDFDVFHNKPTPPHRKEIQTAKTKHSVLLAELAYTLATEGIKGLHTQIAGGGVKSCQVFNVI